MSLPRSSSVASAEAGARYRAAQVLGSRPAELVVLLYERLLADLEGAARAMRSGDTKRKSVRIQRAIDIVFELLSGLDHERGGEVSRRLEALYGYMVRRLAEASRGRNPDILDELARHVDSLLSAWKDVAARGGAVVPEARS